MRQIVLLIIIGLTGCTSISIPVSDTTSYKISDDKVTTNEYQIGDNGYLIGAILGLEYINKDSLRTKKIIVSKNERQIEIKIVHNKQEVTRNFKYKKKEKELRCETKTKIGLLPPIFWSIKNDNNSIFFDSKDNLVIYHNHGGGLFLVFFPLNGASTGQGRGTFELVRN
jgi:hypothetical protein